MGKLTPELRKVLKLQYPLDIVIEVKGEIVHFKDTEENWKKLGAGLGLEVFKEESGDMHWVLYNPKTFEVKSDMDHKYLACISEENIELPINCSSCYGMFREFKFENKDALKFFGTSEVKDMRYMFEYCSFPEVFSLGDKFDTSNVIPMLCMFRFCKLPDGFSLGSKFDISHGINATWMFDNCKLPGGRREWDFECNEYKIIEWLKSRNSDNTSNTNFFK